MKARRSIFFAGILYEKDNGNRRLAEPIQVFLFGKKQLLANGHEVIPIGIRAGVIGGIEIIKGRPEIIGLHAVTLYINPYIQEEYYDYIIQSEPERIIFNTGAGNTALMNLAKGAGIGVLTGCTLVLLSTGQY